MSETDLDISNITTETELGPSDTQATDLTAHDANDTTSFVIDEVSDSTKLCPARLGHMGTTANIKEFIKGGVLPEDTASNTKV